MKMREKPNWKDPDDYDSLKNLDSSQWAWEFLRRNPAYIKEWEMLTEGLTKEQRREAPWSLLKAGLNISVSKWDGGRWGLYSEILNPDLTIEYRHRNIQFIPWGGSIARPIISSPRTHPGMRFFTGPNYQEGAVLFQFNFNLPITPQIEVVKRELLKLQKESREKGIRTRNVFRPHRDEWPILLRILDAQAAGAKNKEIACILFPDDFKSDENAAVKKVHDKRKQAERYVNGDYRLIPCSDK